MNTNPFIATFTLVTLGALTACSSASADNSGSELTQIAFIKDCSIVKQRAMTKDELHAHQELEQMSSQMENLELPMQDFERAMKKHEQAMKQLGEPVVEQDDGKILIDQNKIAQQQLIASDIEKLVSQYQPNIDQLTSQGEKVGDAADRFTSLVRENAQDLDYDNIQVLDTPNEKPHCGVYTL